jgi:ribosomal 50S subunit-recycling heat shock protein
VLAIVIKPRPLIAVVDDEEPIRKARQHLFASHANPRCSRSTASRQVRHGRIRAVGAPARPACSVEGGDGSELNHEVVEDVLDVGRELVEVILEVGEQLLLAATRLEVA